MCDRGRRRGEFDRRDSRIGVGDDRQVTEDGAGTPRPGARASLSLPLPLSLSLCRSFLLSALPSSLSLLYTDTWLLLLLEPLSFQINPAAAGVAFMGFSSEWLEQSYLNWRHAASAR